VTRPCRAIVVDDNRTFLKVVVRLMSSIEGVEVIGESNSARDALELAGQLKPDLILMDLAMPGMDGLEATRRLIAGSDAPAIIIMTVQDMPQYRDAALAAGARQFVAKSDLKIQLEPLIKGLLPGFHSVDDELVLCQTCNLGFPGRPTLEKACNNAERQPQITSLTKH
jgi:DNA-binding NarL/FixJ family response regulator